MPPSIEDVAKLAKVSISTVSRVVNRRDVVSSKTRARVESAIEQLGYRPNAFARGLMLRRSEILGLILPDLHGEYYSEIIRGANIQAREAGYNLIVASFAEREGRASLLGAVQQWALLDGVALMVSELTDQIQQVLGGFRMPVVVLNDDVEGSPHDSVIIDQHEGATALMRHLVHPCGAQRVVFLGGLKTNIDTISRYTAYRDVLAEAGVPYSDRDVYYLDYQYATAYQLGRLEARQWAGERHAVFAANDEMAAGVVAAATAAGVRVPEQLAVVGFDDTRIAQMIHPQLTTVRVPMSMMGARAMELVCQRIGEPERSPTHVSLQPELVVRDSCGVALRK